MPFPGPFKAWRCVKKPTKLAQPPSVAPPPERKTRAGEKRKFAGFRRCQLSRKFVYIVFFIRSIVHNVSWPRTLTNLVHNLSTSQLTMKAVVLAAAVLVLAASSVNAGSCSDGGSGKCSKVRCELHGRSSPLCRKSSRLVEDFALFSNAYVVALLRGCVGSAFLSIFLRSSI